MRRFLGTDLRLRNGSSWTIFIFGSLAFMTGLVSIVQPNMMLRQLGFQVADASARQSFDFTLVFITTSAMASFNIGIYYMLAALNDMKRFYAWTVPFRMLTFTVFTLAVVSGGAPVRFIVVPVWELVGALATGIALYREDFFFSD